jgi:AraC-like DNA-binding protein
MKQADVSSLRMLRQSRDRIDRDYAEEIGIPALAAGAGYSREHFIRSLGTFSARFAELTGMSPTAYRREAARRGGPAPIPGCFALMWRTGLPQAPPPGKGITS